VFALEQLDGRVHYSLPTLACIVVYSASVVVSNIARGWTDEFNHAPDGTRNRAPVIFQSSRSPETERASPENRAVLLRKLASQCRGVCDNPQ
jgi:hypothetical protein